MAERTEKGQFPKGVSGNPAGRPKGAKNQITLLRQSLELSLREASGPQMGEVLTKAFELAMAGDRAMIKLLLELHMTKGAPDEREAQEKVSITIGTHESRNTPIVINGETQNAKADTESDSLLPDANECEGYEVSGDEQGETSLCGPVSEPEVR